MKKDVYKRQERIKVRQPLKEILVDGKYESIIGDLTLSLIHILCGGRQTGSCVSADDSAG